MDESWKQCLVKNSDTKGQVLLRFSLHKMFRICKSTELDHWLPVGKGMVGGNGGITDSRYGLFFKAMKCSGSR